MNKGGSKITTVLLVLLCNIIQCIAQDEIGGRMSFGGISLESDRKITLEKATSGIHYQFSQTVNIDYQTEVKIDTMFLAFGATRSVYLDRGYKFNLENERKSRFARAKKSKMIDNSYENIAGVLDLISINSDYKEDDPGDSIQIFKNRSTGIVSSVYNSYSINVRCDQQVDEMMPWSITELTDTVLGYSCCHATVEYAGRHYSALFTTDIPLNDGPWKFQGLPGLILKVTDNDQLFEWLAIGIENLDADIVMDDGNYEEVGLKQFNDFVNKETGSIMVSFYNNDVLFTTYKKRPYASIPIELQGK